MLLATQHREGNTSLCEEEVLVHLGYTRTVVLAILELDRGRPVHKRKFMVSMLPIGQMLLQARHLCAVYP